MSPSSPYVAWAVGPEGAITAAMGDDGQWVRQHSGIAADLRAVAFCDSAHGWAVGDGGTIIATADGGRAWQRQESHITEPIDAVACADANHIWALADLEEGDALSVAILSTSDGGKTWTTQFTKKTTDISSGIAFADARHGWVTLSEGEILSTSDGGVHWHATEEIECSPTGAVLEGVSCIDASCVWAVGMCGGGFPQSLVLASSNGGATWRQQPLSIRQQPLYSVQFIDALHGWVTPSDGTVRMTVDGGASWQVGRTPARCAFFHQVAFSDARRGWAIAGDRLWRTADGGHSWSRAASARGWNAIAVAPTTR